MSSTAWLPLKSASTRVGAGILRCITIAAAALAVVALPAWAADDELLPLNARFLVAARNADAAAMERFLRDGAAVDSRNRLGESALLIVIKKDRFDLARSLVAAGADVNLAAINGTTPLMAAAYGGDIEFVKLLLDKGAKIDAVDRIKKNAVTYAAGEGRTDVVMLFIARGVDPNAVYQNGLTALMWAAGYGRVDTMRALVAARARTEPRDDRGKTALDIARENGQAAAVEFLETTEKSAPAGKSG